MVPGVAGEVESFLQETIVMLKSNIAKNDLVEPKKNKCFITFVLMIKFFV
jgi:hypothetical protein